MTEHDRQMAGPPAGVGNTLGPFHVRFPPAWQTTDTTTAIYVNAATVSVTP